MTYHTAQLASATAPANRARQKAICNNRILSFGGSLIAAREFAVRVLDRSRSRSTRHLGLPQAAGTGCDSVLSCVYAYRGASCLQHRAWCSCAPPNPRQLLATKFSSRQPLKMSARNCRDTVSVGYAATYGRRKLRPALSSTQGLRSARRAMSRPTSPTQLPQLSSASLIVTKAGGLSNGF